ncbi:hypothetical protein SLEP1_g9872 [Rubroshorea leprosula]|uniref:Uncharacterized protein n=1 Tax=Rubroshorea leprosula TaxID=152421 RepID=A0AAV5IET1_9ROSI|nr:hypothetical protein SLEP1_g9872 [Rubroshorea leprosula]
MPTNNHINQTEHLAVLAQTPDAPPCSQIVKDVVPCLSFLTDGGEPTKECCGGITEIANDAKSKKDCAAICTCLKKALAQIGSYNASRIPQLPVKWLALWFLFDHTGAYVTLSSLHAASELKIKSTKTFAIRNCFHFSGVPLRLGVLLGQIFFYLQHIPLFIIMEKFDISQPISTILNGSNYILWAQSMRSFLKGRKLWQYITGDITLPQRVTDETNKNLDGMKQLRKCGICLQPACFSEPTFNDAVDIGKYIEYRDKMRLIQFLMALIDDFEPCRASLLHQSPLPTLDSAFSRLLSDETRLGLLKPQRDTIVAATINKFPSSHIAPNCTTSLSQRSDQWKTQSKPDQSSKPMVVAAAANEDTSVHLSIGNLETLIRQMISSSSTSTALPTIPGKVSWIFDSGCCNHMTSNSTLFSTLTPNTIAPPIHTADGSQMQVSQYGQVCTSTLTLPNTFLIPKLTFNLISVGQLCELGLELIFSTHGCLVQDPQTGQILGTGCKVGRLFELTSLHIPSSYIS